MVWATLRSEGVHVNRKAIQGIMQIKRWQCHRRLNKSCYPRVEVSSSIAQHSNERWATDFICIWTYVSGQLYGTTLLGGGTNCKAPAGSGCGTVFAVKP